MTTTRRSTTVKPRKTVVCIKSAGNGSCSLAKAGQSDASIFAMMEWVLATAGQSDANVDRHAEDQYFHVILERSDNEKFGV